MLSPQALLRGIVQRALTGVNPDNASNDVAARMFPYGEVATMPLVRKCHVLADEGSYFVTNNAQTAIVPTYGTGLVATSPFILIYNGNTNNQRLYLDYAALAAVVAGACTTAVGYIACAVVIDTGNRYTSGGTNLTANIVSPNMAAAGAPAGVLAYCGAIVATAATAGRTVCGLRVLRPGVSTTVINVIGDMHLLNFGGVEGAVGSITVANANIMPQALPPVVIGPGQSALIYLWFPVMTAPSAATFAPEIAFWLR